MDAALTLTTLAPEARRVLVALSGGGDSVALLRLLHASASENQLELVAAHFDHALRPESASDARFVADLCEALGVPLEHAYADVRAVAKARTWNLEDAARRLRYSFLTRVAKRVGADIIVTAHTRDDQAETVLLQLLRGAAFLRGIPARRGRLVRPLLAVSRLELRHYLQDLGQAWCEDESNADRTRTRAWLRHEVIPHLETRYPALKETLARLAALQYDVADDLEARAAPFVQGGIVEAATLAAQAPPLQRTALSLLLKRAGIAPDALHLEAMRDALDSRDPVRLALPGDRLARVAYGRLRVILGGVPEPRAPELAHTLPAEVAPEKLEGFPVLHYRSRLPGDRIRLSGGSKKLSDLLIDARVPREARALLRVLATSAETPGDVLWVEGVATDVRVARRTVDPDAHFMALALCQAEAASEAGEVPVGALVVRGDEIVAEAANRSLGAHDPTAHAELLALRAAAQALGDWRLEGCTLYVTLEPCPMCFGAILAAHLPRLVYGASNRREGALGGVADLQQHPWKRQLVVRSGVQAAEAERLLSTFFASRREAPKAAEARVTKGDE